jgi:CheY-like chemotaxis protein
MSAFVLVVEDDRAIRATLCDLLADEGHRAVGAANGKEALDILRRGERPDVILLDVMMPVMDGPTFRAEQLRDPSLSSIPVAVITAGGQDAAASVKVEPEAVLLKPLRIEDVLKVVDRLCRDGRRTG